MFERLTMRFACSSVVACAALGSCATPHAPAPVRAEDLAKGADSRILAPEILRIRSHDELLRAWNRHKGLPAAAPPVVMKSTPKIDFEQYEVVAIFGGETSSSDGVWVVEVVDEGAVRRVRFDSLTYQSAGGGQAVRMRRSQGAEFGFFLLPRTEREVVVEENVQNELGAPPVWEVRARV